MGFSTKITDAYELQRAFQRAAATGGGSTIIEAVGNAAGVSTAQATSQSIVESAAQSVGASTVSGAAQAIVGAAGASVEQSVVSGDAQAVVVAVGESAGLSTVGADAQAIIEAVTESAGQATADAVGQDGGAAIIEAVGECSGISVVLGVGYTILPIVPSVPAVVSEGSGGHRKKYKMHPAAPAIPASMLKRIHALEKKVKRPKVDIEAIIRELEEICARIQEAIELSSSAVAAYSEAPAQAAPEAVAIEKRIGPRSLTARVATEKARQVAFTRARMIEAEAERVSEVAREEEFLLVAHAIGIVAMMVD